MNYTKNAGEKAIGRRLGRIIFILCLVTVLLFLTVGCQENVPTEIKSGDTSDEGTVTNQPSDGKDIDGETDDINLGTSYFKDRLDKYAADYKRGTESDAIISPAFLIADVKGDGKADFIFEGAVGGYPNSSYAFFNNISIVEKIQDGYADVISISKNTRNVAFIRNDCRELVLLSYCYALDDGTDSDMDLALYIADLKKDQGKWVSNVLLDDSVSFSEYETYFYESMSGEYLLLGKDNCKAVIESTGITIGDEFTMFDMDNADIFFPNVTPDSDDYKSYDIKADISAYFSKNDLL